jgi:hypothetical protein
MPDFTTRLADGWRRARRSPRLALVPLVFGLADVDRLRAILAFDGIHVGVRFGLPASVVTLWQFVSLPQSGVNVDPGVPVETLPVAVVTVPTLLLVQAALAAGYFGSLADQVTTGDSRFGENVTAHFVPFLVLGVVPVVVLLPVALGLFGLGAATGEPTAVVPFTLLAVPALLLFAYLFYTTPYLVVLRDTGVVAAARAAYGLAIDGGAYLAYTAGVALFVLVISPVATAVVVNVPVVGLPVGLVGGSVLGVALNVATMRFVADVDPASPSAGRWPEEDGDGDDTRDRTDRDDTGDGPPPSGRLRSGRPRHDDEREREETRHEHGEEPHGDRDVGGVGDHADESR